MSNRQKFRDIIPSQSLLDILDKYHLGYNAKRRRRVAIAKKFGNEKGKDPQSKKAQRIVDSPYPFNKPGKPLFTVNDPDDIKNEFSNTPPEFAVIGRSNVGKSTFLNSLLCFDNSYVQKSEVSDKPGVTKSLHFYGLGRNKNVIHSKALSQANEDNIKLKVNNHQLIGIDMPGYGFAFSSDEDRIRCGLLCSNFLRFRGSSLKRVFLLLDARHGFKLSDKIYFYHLLNCENPASAESISSPFDGTKLIPKGNIDIFKKNSDIHWKLQVILTKADLVERMDLARRIHLINDELTDILPGLCGGLPIVALSGKYKDGIVQVQRDLISLIPKNIIHSEQNE